PQDTGLVAMTVSRQRYAVWEDTLLLIPARVVATESRTLIDDGNFGTIGNGDGIPSPGERIALALVVKNYGDTTYAGGALYMTTNDPMLHLETEVRVIPELEPSESSPPLLFFVVPTEQSQDGHRAILTAALEDANWQEQFVIAAPVPQFLRIHNDGEPAFLEPGGTAQFGVEILNTGSLSLPASTLRLYSTDPRVHVLEGEVSLAELAAGATAWSLDDFSVQLDEVYPGEPLAFQLEIGAWAGHGDTLHVTLPSGEITESDPTAPDAYGYRCFDDGDATYSEAPNYSWVEIDPALGGPGTTLALTDNGPGWDNTLSIPLPFEFQFYGQSHDSISISTNGFAALGKTDESFFRNYRIPAIASPAFMIAPFWDDLATEGGGRICTWHDEDGGRFIIEWNGLHNQYGARPEETFQILLHDPSCWPTRTGDGDIIFQYAAFNNADAFDNYATIGLQDRRSGFFHEISYANENVSGAGLIRDGRALKFTTGQPVAGPYLRFAGILIDDDAQGGSQGNGDGMIQNGETVQLQFQFENVGTENVPPFTGVISEFSPHANMLDNSINFGAIAPADTTASSVVRVQFLNTIADGEFVNFLITLSEGALPCVLLPSVSARGPVLSPLPELISDDNSGQSQGNGNGEVNPGELIELFPRALNSGGNIAVAVDAHIQILSGPAFASPNTTNVGTVEPLDTITASGAVVIHVDENAGNNQLITYRLTFTDAYGTSWFADREMIVVEPILSYHHLTVLDPLPGGDGDGIAEPGETVEVYPVIRNEGSGSATNVALNFSTGDPYATLLSNSIAMGTLSGNSERTPASPLRVLISSELVPLHQIRISINIVSAESPTIFDEFAVLVGAAQFFEDFNGDNVDGWLTYGEPAGLWHRQDREFSSAPFAFYCGDEESQAYPPFADSYLRTPEFDFSGTGTLRISMRYETQTDPDQCRIDLQSGFSTYHRLATLQGNSGGWITQEYSLDDLPADTSARLRFWFVSNATAVGDGWYIDDVAILEGPTSIDPGETAIPERLTFEQNFPNPFNGPTIFNFSLPQRANAKLDIYSLDGRLVTTLVDETLDAGAHVIRWTPLSLASGMYLARLSTSGSSLTKKMLYLK
ncbi:T9SS type A sorting domain-containing protein, partial [bacterium]|nr:T9SS type A sorting domain-containing protein [bacterium]